MRQGKILVLLSILAVIITISALYYFNGAFSLNTISPLGGGVTILGLSNVQITSQNQNNFTGSYWFAQLLLNGPFSPISTSCSSLNPGSNYSCNAQTDTIKINTLNNQVIYQANGNSGSTVLNTYSASLYTGSFSYTDCNGNTQIVYGNNPTYGWGCLLGSNNGAAVASYITACETAAASGSTFGVGVIVSGGAECYAVSRNSWGTLFQLSEGSLNSTVQVAINGQAVKVSNQQPEAFIKNATGKVTAGAYFLPQQAGTFFGPPSPQTVGILFANKTQRRLLQYSSLSTVIQTQDTINQSIRQISQQPFGSSFCGAAPISSSKCFFTSISALNSALASNNTKLAATMFVQPASSYPLGIYNNGTNSYKLILNDTSFTYIRPQIEFFTSAASLGFVLDSAVCQIEPINNVKFVSGGTYTLNVNVKNTGTAPGACITTATRYNSQAITVTPLTSGTGPLVQPGVTATYSFNINSNQDINASTAITFQSCNAATLRPCTNTTAQVQITSQCSNGQVLTNGNCQPVSTITVPTTIPNSGSTSIIPQVTCQPPSIFNQTLYNEHVNPPCWIPPAPGTPLWEIVAIVGVGILITVGIIFAIRRYL